MHRFGRPRAAILAAILLLLPHAAAAAPEFVVQYPAAQAAGPLDGRLLVILSPGGTDEPRFQVGWGADAIPFYGRDVEGWRPEFIALFREMRVTTMRWAGNFSAGYEWRDGIGDPDRRPPRYEFAWRSLEPNDVGTFEVLALNRLVGSEPYIGVNAGLGDAHSAGQWVEYVNGSTDTPMGKLRAQHGHPQPFGVKWWGVGNEMYGEWQIGHMSIDHFVITHNMFAAAMRAADRAEKPASRLAAKKITPNCAGSAPKRRTNQ